MRKKNLDLVGERFSNLLVLEELALCQYPSGQSARQFKCRCDCGNYKTIIINHLRSGDTKSCGCLSRSRVIKRNTKHGYASRNLPKGIYAIWQSMIQRCTNPKNKAYPKYGGRGITVCAYWQGEHGFENFLADMGHRKHRETLERINNNGNYEPNNCKWATRIEQANNMSTNVQYIVNGEILTMAQLSRKYKIPYHKVQYYLRNKKMTVNSLLQKIDANF